MDIGAFNNSWYASQVAGTAIAEKQSGNAERSVQEIRAARRAAESRLRADRAICSDAQAHETSEDRDADGRQYWRLPTERRNLSELDQTEINSDELNLSGFETGIIQAESAHSFTSSAQTKGQFIDLFG